MVPSKVIACPSELKYYFNDKKGAKRFFYVYRNVVMKDKTEKDKADNIIAYLDDEAFEYYFENFIYDIALNKEPRSLQKVKTEKSVKFSAKKTGAEVMKEEVNLAYKCGNVIKFSMKASYLQKEVNSND